MGNTITKELIQEFEVHLLPCRDKDAYDVIILKTEFNIDDETGERIQAGRWYMQWPDREIFTWKRLYDAVVLYSPCALIARRNAGTTLNYLAENGAIDPIGQKSILTRDLFWPYMIPILRAVKE